MATLFVDKVDPQSGTALEIGTSGDTITVPSGATFNVAGTLQSGGSALISGITQADQWRITSNASLNSGDVVSTNWERNDNDYDKIGDGMSESSGVFTFPETGIYLIHTTLQAGDTTDQDYVGFILDNTLNDGGAWDTLQDSYGNITSSGGAQIYVNVSDTCMVDITDLSNHKIRLKLGSENAGVSVKGSSNSQKTGLTFIRLGAT
jgi:hypothetical protein